MAPPSHVDRQMRLPDGRQLGWAEGGDPDGQVLLWCHGTPSSRLEAIRLFEPAARAGWRLAAPDRPGHGLSGRDPGATIASVGRDLAALVDHLGAATVVVAGFSGGAAFALAGAVELDGRARQVGLVSPWGPPDRPGAYAEVAWSERLSDDVARRCPAITAALFSALGLAVRMAPGRVAGRLSRRLEGGSGGDEPTRPGESLAPLIEALRQGGRGPARDLHLIVRPWGLDLTRVTAPVRIWHGDRDPEIPLHHARYLADALPRASLEVLAGGDHLTLFVRADEILAGLADLAASTDLWDVPDRSSRPSSATGDG